MDITIDYDKLLNDYDNKTFRLHRMKQAEKLSKPRNLKRKYKVRGKSGLTEFY